MSRLFKLAGIPVLAIGLAFMTSGAKADAGGFSISIGNYGYRGYAGNHRGYGGYQSLRPSYGPSIYYGRSYRPSYNYSRVYGHSSYRSGYQHPRRPHYDYHAPTLIPHGNHYDYVPGHWDLHHRGHIHH